MTAEKLNAAPDAAPQLINVQVRYPAAPKPYIDPKAQPAETLGQLKSRVLTAFEVAETQGPEQQVLFFLYHENDRLDDLNRTLGQIVGGDRVLKLKLVQQIVQG